MSYSQEMRDHAEITKLRADIARLQAERDEAVTALAAATKDKWRLGREIERLQTALAASEALKRGYFDEIERLRVALYDILLLDGKRMTGRQKIDAAITLAKRAYEQSSD